MKLSYFLAKKYFFSKSRKSFVNKISALSIIIISLMIVAEIVVLSVFNGYTDQLKSIHKSFDSEFQIVPKKKKVFEISDSTIQKINNIAGIRCITKVLEDDAILDFRGHQDVVRFRGVDTSFFSQNEIEDHLYLGDTDIFQDFPMMVMGIGVEYKFDINIRNNVFCRLMYPNRKMTRLKKSTGSYKDIMIQPKGVFQIEMEYDEKYIIIPINHARTLTGYDKQITALEIGVNPDADLNKISTAIKLLLPIEIKLQDREERHESIYKAIQIEKLLTYFIFVLILFIASLNLYASVSMLVLSKKKDINTLNTLGASSKVIQQIFLLEGVMIIVTGIISGAIIAYLLIWLQDNVGLVPVPEPNSLLSHVPVRIKMHDFVISICLTFLVSMIMISKPIFSSTKNLNK